MPSRSESALDRIARSLGGDWALNRLAWFAAQGLALPVTFLVDGQLIAGDTSRPDPFMQSIDDAIRQSLDASEAAHAVQPPADPEALAGFEGMTAGDFALVRENFEKGVAFMPIVEHGREHDAELLAKIREHELNETPWDDLPEEIQGWIAERDRPVVNAMTLQNVVWTSVAGREIPLSVPVRIMLTNVSLWWFGRAVRQDSDE